MSTKTFELTIDERNTLLDVLWHCMETNSNCNMEYESETHTYVWSTPEAEQEHNRMKALYDKLKPIIIQRSGWMLKTDRVLDHRPELLGERYRYITWEDQV